MEKDKKEYKLSGMTCAACAMTIEMVVNDLSTVEEATVNLATEKLTVFPKEGFASEQVLDAVKEAGYQAVEKGEQKQSDYAKQAAEKEETVRQMARQIWFAAGATVPLLYISMGSMIAVALLFRSHDASHCLCIGAVFPYFASDLGWSRFLCTWFSEFGKTASEHG